MQRKIKDKINTFTLLSPWLITLGVFWLYPLIYAAWLSFTEYNTLSNQSTFIGFDNYIKMINDSDFWQALWNTTIFTFGTVPFTTAFALIFATLINSRLARFRNFFKASYFLPSVTSLVVIALIFTNLYSTDGYINTLLEMLGIPYPERGWLLEPSTALLSIMAMDVWMATGYYMILFLAGMQTISDDLYDAADLAGASKWTQFFRITLPMLKPTLLFVLVINTIKSFQVFIEVYVMTKGGPMGSTTTLVYLVFENAFKHTDMMGYASAIAYILFIILIALSLFQMKVLKTDET
jgi:multiple sugar transport system permease protein